MINHETGHNTMTNWSGETDMAIVIWLSHTTKEFLPNHGQALTQPITGFRDDVTLHYDDVIPECYAANMPYIRACRTSAKQTSRGSEDKQGSQELKARLEATLSRS